MNQTDLSHVINKVTSKKEMDNVTYDFENSKDLICNISKIGLVIVNNVHSNVLNETEIRKR